MALDITPVHRNLMTRPTFFWLEFEDWFVVIGLAAVMNIVGRLLNRVVLGIPLNLVLQFAVPTLAIPLLLMFKYGKPRGYLLDLMNWHTKPRVYSSYEADDELRTEYLSEVPDAARN